MQHAKEFIKPRFVFFAKAMKRFICRIFAITSPITCQNDHGKCNSKASIFNTVDHRDEIKVKGFSLLKFPSARILFHHDRKTYDYRLFIPHNLPVSVSCCCAPNFQKVEEEYYHRERQR